MRILIALTLGIATLVQAAPTAATPASQVPCFSETNYCITEPAFEQYFTSRGGARTLGFPVSRVFRLEGFSVQFYQRVVLQLQGGNVARLNLLDPGILPVTRANQSVFPAPDPGLAADAPRPDDAAYAQRVVEYLGAVSPNTWNNLPVGFSSLFNTTVPSEGVAPEIRTLLNLEIWGLPTSQPAFDPGNGGFVYQRFQRGIMHFRTECGCTEGILVGDYLKTVLTGRDLPPDLAAEMRTSRFFSQYQPGAAGWLARPGDLTDTDLTGAFEPGTADVAGVTVAPTATPTPAPVVVAPTATPTPAPVTPTTAQLAGLVKPGQNGIRVAFIDLPLETSTAGDGAYAIGDVPFGEHFVYAMDPKGQVSDTYRVNLNAPQIALNMDLQEFKPGSPGLFVGHVVGNNNAPQNGATVWRLGGAGRTSSENQGLFRLVDTFADASNPKAPDKVTLIAVSGDRWGLTTVNFAGDPNKDRVEIKLTRQGNPPSPPKRISGFQPNDTSKVFDANIAEFLTVRFPSNGTDFIGFDIVDKDGKALSENAFTLKSSSCLGECNTFDGSAYAIKLPRNQPFRIQLKSKNGGDITKPGWDEAQFVSTR
jgi:hypothetical protein